MAMVVKNNMAAISTLNTLNKNSAGLTKSLAKVSSGQRVNGAADDASGYAISERMRVQVRALDQDNRNTQSGTSMMKVAEGAVSSTVDILKTLKEKVVSAANDDKTDSDRAAIQKELDQSIDQINDNANVTFNGKYLVDGSHNNAVITGGVRNTMTNESLSENTVASTKFHEMNDRNGNTLNIQDTDTIKVSYVKEGKTYNASVKGTDTFGDLLAAANKAGYSVDGETGDIVEEAVSLKNTATNGNASGTATAFSTIGLSSAKLSTALTADNLKIDGNDIKVSINGTDVKIATATGISGGISLGINNSGGTLNITGAVDTNGDAVAVNISATLGADLDAVTGIATAADASGLKTANGVVASDSFSATINFGNEIGTDQAGLSVYTPDRGKAVTFTAETAGVASQISGVTISVEDQYGKINKSANAVLDNFSESIRAQNVSSDNAIVLQVGTKANQAIKVGLTDMRAQALGLQSAEGETIQVGTQKNANAAINVLDNAISKALDQQTTIGSVQSRLEYTSQNLTTASENVQASESTIRDADMAKEMTEYTKNNVLLQAAQSMLAQANQNSSAVLSLLQ